MAYLWTVLGKIHNGALLVLICSGDQDVLGQEVDGILLSAIHDAALGPTESGTIRDRNGIEGENSSEIPEGVAVLDILGQGEHGDVAAVLSSGKSCRAAGNTASNDQNVGVNGVTRGRGG